MGRAARHTNTLTTVSASCFFCPPGPCSGECQNKKPHTDGDDDEDQSDRGAGSQAVKAAEERPNRPENGAEVQ